MLTFICLALFSINIFAQATEKPKAADAKTIAEVEAFENDLIQALRKGDRAALERMLAEGFVFIHSTGAIETREEYLKNAGGGNLRREDTANVICEISKRGCRSAAKRWVYRNVFVLYFRIILEENHEQT